LAVYKFDRVSVMVCEDNAFVRRTLEDVLRQFGFERITLLKNGQEAIESLKLLKQAKNPGPDLIIADLVMAPINGLLLCRWCRSAKETPNRMVPFLMLSGAADQDYVGSARDLGATEFLAKPFSGESIYKKLLEVIDFPRQFVMNQNYFGPDRRRKKDPPPDGSERREKSEEDCTVVYSAEKMTKPKSDSDVYLFKPTNYLREKCAGGKLNPLDRGEMPTALIEQAEKKLERAALDFTKWAQDYLGRLSDLCTQALLEPGRRTQQFTEINQVALELRGQGGTFGYPLISIFGKMLFDSTRDGCREDDAQVEIVKAHVDSMRAVLREKIAGDGGAIGQELIKALRAGIEKQEKARKAALDELKRQAGG
jgi:CheY-like chemotaxis protein